MINNSTSSFALHLKLGNGKVIISVTKRNTEFRRKLSIDRSLDTDLLNAIDKLAKENRMEFRPFDSCSFVIDGNEQGLATRIVESVCAGIAVRHK